MSDDHSMHLLARWRSGDEEAAAEIFERYVGRLAGLARTRLSEKMQRRVDPEDVVQSAYRSFFRHAQADRYELRRSGDLWRLLAAITINKVRGQVEFHQAAKRSIDQEGEPPEGPSMLEPNALAREPTVEEAVTLSHELEAVMQSLDPLERTVLELRLQDQSSAQIAEAIERSSRTVRRILERIKQVLAERFELTVDEDG